MSIFNKVWDWLKKEFTLVEKDAAPIAVAVVEGLKTASDTGILDWAGHVVDGLTKSNVASNIITKVEDKLPAIAAAALALETPPAPTATQEEIVAYEEKIIKGFGMSADKSKVYSTIGADVIRLIRDEAAAEAAGKSKFAVAVTDLEAAYQDMKAATQPDTDDTNA